MNKQRHYSVSEIALLQVSFFKNKTGMRDKDMSVGQVLNDIRSGAYREQIEQARTAIANGDKVTYDAIKGNLPAVTFCGTYQDKRKADKCQGYTNLFVLDIDKLEQKQLSTIREQMKEDCHVAALWLSPSGRGFKGLVPLAFHDTLADRDLLTRHKIASETIFEYFMATYGIELDRSGSDLSRLCFMSYDSNLFIKESTLPLMIEPRLENSTEKSHSKGGKATTIKGVKDNCWNSICGNARGYKDNKANKNLLLCLCKKLEKKNISITENWTNWNKVAFCIASCIHPEPGREIFLRLCRLDGAKHDEQASDLLIKRAYLQNRGMVKMGSIIFLARQKGIVIDR